MPYLVDTDLEDHESNKQESLDSMNISRDSDLGRSIEDDEHLLT